MKSKKRKTSFTIPKSKKLSRTFLVLTIIFFFFVIILSSSFSVIYDKETYFQEQEKSTVYEDINKTQAQNVTEKIIDYFRYEQNLETEFLTENELLHLKDVKNLINKLLIFYYLSIILMVLFFILYYKTTDDFFKSLTRVLIFGSLAIILIFLLLYFIDFSFLFDKFNIMFFESNYLFPAKSNIIRLFPQEFFSGIFFLILKISMIKTFILLMTGILINSLNYFSRIHARP